LDIAIFYLSFIFLIEFVQSSHQAAKSINVCVCVCLAGVKAGCVHLCRVAGSTV